MGRLRGKDKKDGRDARDIKDVRELKDMKHENAIKTKTRAYKKEYSMRKIDCVLVLLLALSLFGWDHCMYAQESALSSSTKITADDAYLWLEDVTGDKAIEWVKARNQKSQAKLEADPSFDSLRDDLLAILDSDARIPMIDRKSVV